MSIQDQSPLDTYQNKFCLQTTNNLGGVIWKCEDYLSMAIIVGQDHLGSKYVVKNQPKKRNYRLVPMDRYVNTSCYFDTDNDVYDYSKIALFAFEMLYQYNDFNQETYDADFKIILPEKKSFITKPPFNFNEFQKRMIQGTVDPLKDWVAEFWENAQRLYDHLRQRLFPQKAPALPPAPEVETPLLNVASSPRIIDIEERRKIKSA